MKYLMALAMLLLVGCTTTGIDSVTGDVVKTENYKFNIAVSENSIDPDYLEVKEDSIVIMEVYGEGLFVIEGYLEKEIKGRDVFSFKAFKSGKYEYGFRNGKKGIIKIS